MKRLKKNKEEDEQEEEKKKRKKDKESPHEVIFIYFQEQILSMIFSFKQEAQSRFQTNILKLYIFYI